MKRIIDVALTFTPASKTIDFANVQSFILQNLYAVINITAGKIIYAPGVSGKGYTTLVGTVLTLQYDTTTMSASDKLMAIYDDIEGQIYNATLPTVADGQTVPWQADNRGRQLIRAYQEDGILPTYSASLVFAPSVTAPTDIFTISGSATKVIKILKITVTATQTTGAQRDIFLIKRSTANTGGTSSTLVNASHDSTNPASTAVVRSYTVNPTALGTSVGNIAVRKVAILTATGNSDEAIFDFGNRPGQAIYLRGTAETLAVNLNGVASTGNSFAIKIEWAEF